MSSAISTGRAGSRAFVWRNGEFWDLNDLIPPLPNNGVLVSAHGINDIGEIVGVGETEGKSFAYLVPEPNRMWMDLAVLLAITVLQGRSKKHCTDSGSVRQKA